MSEATVNDAPPSNETSATATRPPMIRASTMPITPTSPFATSPWYQQKFELFRDVIEEKVRDEYPDLPPVHKIQPADIQRSAVKGYDLDFPIELHDGQNTVVSVAYGTGPRPPYTKEDRRKLVTIRQNTTGNS